MPGTARRGRRLTNIKKKDTENKSSETEETGAEEEMETDNPALVADESETTHHISDDECKDPETDQFAASDENGAGEGKEVDEMTVDLEIKDETEAGTETEAKEEAVEVMIERLPEPSVNSNETLVPEKQDVSVAEADSKVNTSVEKKSAVKEDVIETADATQPLGTEDGKAVADVAMVTATDSSIKDDVIDGLVVIKSDLGTESAEGPPAETLKSEGTSDAEAEPVTPVKEADQTTSDLTPSSTPDKSPVLTDSPDQESKRLHFPASLAKLRNLTVNIGPIRQMDLKSDKLHEILTLSDNFEIKFELKDKKDVHGRLVQEKSGFVRLPFEITTPTFLIRVAHRLGSLHIDGRDMSVKFPEAFNKALEECKQYMEEVRKIRDEKFETKKRQILVKNVPANVSEETIRSLFPEAQKVTLRCYDSSDGGSKVGSVLLDFETEEACIQCLDTNKDVFIEDCQLKIYKLYSEKRYTNRATRQPMYTRGRGFGRGRGMGQRGGFQAAKIRKRVLGFGNIARSKGIQGSLTRGSVIKKPIVNLSRNPAAPVATSTQANTMSQGVVGLQKSSPRGPASIGRGERRWSSGGTRQGSYQGPVSHEGQFKGFNTPNREVNRGRRGSRPYRGRGNKGYQQRSVERSPSFRGEQPRESPHRSDRSQHRSGGSYRTEQRYSPSTSSNRDEDPRAMMEYLKSTIARMEEKMTTRDYGDRAGYDREEQSRSSSYSSRGRGSPSRARGRGRGEQSRKRPSDSRDYGQEAKRPFMGDQDRRDSRSEYYVSPQNRNTGGRRDSVGRAVGEMLSDYRHDRESSSHAGSSFGGGQRGGNRGSYRGSHGGSQGYRSGSYGDNSDRNRRDSYGGRSESFSKGYSGGQFGSRGRGASVRGQSRGRGYNKGSGRGQLW